MATLQQARKYAAKFSERYQRTCHVYYEAGDEYGVCTEGDVDAGIVDAADIVVSFDDGYERLPC